MHSTIVLSTQIVALSVDTARPTSLSDAGRFGRIGLWLEPRSAAPATGRDLDVTPIQSGLILRRLVRGLSRCGAARGAEAPRGVANPAQVCGEHGARLNVTVGAVRMESQPQLSFPRPSAGQTEPLVFHLADREAPPPPPPPSAAAAVITDTATDATAHRHHHSPPPPVASIMASITAVITVVITATTATAHVDDWLYRLVRRP